MTELIQKAIDKIDGEAEKLNNSNAMLIASHIIENYLKNDSNAQKVLDEKKTFKICISQITSKAKKEAVGNMAMIPKETVFQWAADYYGFSTDAPKENKIVDIFDLI